MLEYKKRIADELLEKKLKGKGAILVKGPKWCGKTTTSEQIAKSVLYMANPDTKSQNLIMADINPSQLLDGDVPRLIDEWQIAPKIWDAVRFTVDHRNKPGQFILTGSSVPPSMDEVSHSGTGRIGRLNMRPMTLYESGESNGSVSLSDLFDNKKISGHNELSFSDIAFLCCRGGWPSSIFLEKDIALEQPFDYIESVVQEDISRVDGVIRNPERAMNLLRSYSRNIASQASNNTIRDDMLANDSDSLDVDTVVSYANALRKLYIIEDSLAWNPNLRSKTAVRTSKTRYLVDPSLVVASLGIGPNDLLNDLNTFGMIFESLCIRDLRVYAESLNGKVYHYRDSSNLECDAVIHLRNSLYGLVEIKLGGDKLIEEGASNLIKLANDIKSKPAFLMILTAVGDYAYQRKDGIYVVPIGCLKN